MTTQHRQQGFTLIEVITVMVLLVALATITVKSTAQLAFDGRYQVTQDRYDKIKTAILGNPNQTINGHPSVSGFVADMGRLPNCIRELIDGWDCAAGTPQVGSITPYQIDKNHCVNNTTYNTVADSLCPNGTNTATDTWVTGTCVNPTTYAIDKSKMIESACTVVSTNTWIPSTGLGYGWRGYIETPNDPTKQNAFTDGWGRKEQCFNATNQPDYNFSNETTCEANAGYTWVTVDDTYPDYNYGWIFNNFVSNQLTILRTVLTL